MKDAPEPFKKRLKIRVQHIDYYLDAMVDRVGDLNPDYPEDAKMIQLTITELRRLEQKIAKQRQTLGDNDQTSTENSKDY